MPLPAVVPIAAAGLSAIGSTLSNIFTNRANRRFQVRMWERQNAYNHPIKQMERLKAAGLNPNLIYGTGQASAGNASQPNTPNQQAPEVDFMSAFTQYQNFKNLIKQEKLLDENTNKTIMQQQEIGANINNKERKLFETIDTYDERLSKINLDLTAKQLSNVQNFIFNMKLPRKLEAEIQKIIQDKATSKANQTLLQIKQEIESKILQDRKMDLNPNSPLWERKIGQLLDFILREAGWKINN